MNWFIVLLLSPDYGQHVHAQIMLQPFPTRAECERSAAFAQIHGRMEAAYCIPDAKARRVG